MGKVSDIFLDSAFYRRALSRWATAAQNARSADLNTLRQQSKRARHLRSHLDQLIHVADERLSAPVPGAADIPAPHTADWVWRPEPWRGCLPVASASPVTSGMEFGQDVKIFHDCSRHEITLRQQRNRHSDDRSPYGLQVEVFEFDGSFLSIVVELPDAAISGLKRDHILSINMTLEGERPVSVYTRLNIRFGPNTEQMVRSFPKDQPGNSADFDLAYADFNDKRVDAAWVDLIFEAPRMNLVTLRDLTFHRHRRAQL